MKSLLRPAVPVTVNVSRLSNGNHTIYAKDGHRVNVSIQEKAITGLRIIDNDNHTVPIHTIKRLSRDGRTYMTENPERVSITAQRNSAMAPPFVPGDCGVISGGLDSWWWHDRMRKTHTATAAHRCGAGTIDCSNIDPRAVRRGLKKHLTNIWWSFPQHHNAEKIGNLVKCRAMAFPLTCKGHLPTAHPQNVWMTLGDESRRLSTFRL